MIDRNWTPLQAEDTQSFNLRGFLEIGFRQRRVIINLIPGDLSVAVLLAFLLPKKYEAQMKILVRHERAESWCRQNVSHRFSGAPSERGRTAIGSGIDSSRGIYSQRVVVACDLQILASAPSGTERGTRTTRESRAQLLHWRRTLPCSPSNLRI